MNFVRNISRSGRMYRNLVDYYSDVLRGLKEVTGADKAALFSMNTKSRDVQLVATINFHRERFNQYRERLGYSPISDVVIRGEYLFENDADRHNGKYLRLLRCESFGSCIGVPVEDTVEELGYTVFLFHRAVGHFKEIDFARTEAAAMRISQALREDWIIHQAAIDQRVKLNGAAITSIAHEMNNLLGAVRSIDDMKYMWERISNSPQRCQEQNFQAGFSKHLERVQVALLGIQRLSGILLGVARQTEEREIQIYDCLSTAIQMAEREAAKAHVRIIQGKKPDVPKVRANQMELEQVLLNVIMNAIQQMPKSHRRRGNVSISVENQYLDHSCPIKIRISDTGPGIHAQNIEKVFEPLYTTKSSGTGMGLYICRELLQKVGGRISIEKTAILVGTTFLIELPAA